MNYKFLKLIMFIVVAFFLFQCSDDDTDVITDEGEDTVVIGTPGITFLLTVPGTGAFPDEYLVTSESVMEGELTAEGQGIELTDWNYVHSINKTLFTFGYENDKSTAYQVDENNNVAVISEFETDAPLEVFSTVDDETVLAMDAPRDATVAERTLYTINGTTGQVEDLTNLSIYNPKDVFNSGDTLTYGGVAYPSGIRVVGDNMFVSFYMIDDLNQSSTPFVDTAYVAVYSYPNIESEPKAVIKDTRTSNIGNNGSSSGIVATESGDIYSYSCGAYLSGFYPSTSKPSGILKIANGSTEFDENYFFNVQEAENGGIIFWMDYVGDNKVIARLMTEDIAIADDPDGLYWYAGYGYVDNQKLVIIDLEAQTITEVADVPLHSKQYTSSPIFVEDGKVYLSIEVGEDANVYEVDIETATATQGAAINGATIKGFWNLY